MQGEATHLPRRARTQTFERLKPLLAPDAVQRSSLATLSPAEAHTLAGNRQRQTQQALAELDLGYPLRPEQVRRLDDHLVQVVSAVVNPHHGLVALGETDLSAAVRVLAQKVVGRDSLDDVVLTVGMGGAITLPSLRLPAVLIPAARTLRELAALREEGVISELPWVRVFKADHAAIAINGFNSAAVLRVSEVTQRFAGAFVAEFFADVAHRFVFESDRSWATVGSTVCAEVDKAAQLLQDVLPDDGVHLRTLDRMGFKHGGADGRASAVRYAAAHPLYGQSINRYDGTLSISDFVDAHPRPALVIDHGADAQRVFNEVGTMLRNRMASDEYYVAPQLNLQLRHARIPVYYRASGGDLLLGDDHSGRPTDHRARQDLEFIQQAVGADSYLRFVRAFYQEHSHVLDVLR